MKNNTFELNLILLNKLQNIIDKDDEISIAKYIKENIDEILEWVKAGTGSIYNTYTDNDRKYIITLKKFHDLSDDEKYKFHEKGNHGECGFVISNIEIEYNDPIVLI